MSLLLRQTIRESIIISLNSKHDKFNYIIWLIKTGDVAQLVERYIQCFIELRPGWGSTPHISIFFLFTM
jgi:hypothetical protein